MVRYHGVLAPASKLRKRVVRDRRKKEAPVASTAPAGSSKKGEREVAVGVAGRIGLEEELRPQRMSWAELMKRVFELDVLECPECKGRMKVISTITDPEVVRKFLGNRSAGDHWRVSVGAGRLAEWHDGMAESTGSSWLGDLREAA